MNSDNRNKLECLIKKHRELGISEQIDYNKFYLYSIITHSTAIEGSTVTEIEAQLLFDEGIAASKRNITELNMNLDLKNAYDYGLDLIKKHKDITVEQLIFLSSKVMSRTGSEYHSIGGTFDSSKGELRKVNVTAGFAGKSYMNYLKVPSKLHDFCRELNYRRKNIDKTNISEVYGLSFWAHYELVTIHPWVDGNGRMSRLLMNLLQFEYDVLPVKILSNEKAEYIQSLIDTREKEDIEIFADYLVQIHCRHLESDINNYVKSISLDVADKTKIVCEMADKWLINPVLADKLADILVFVADKPVFSSKEIVSHFGFSETTVRRFLRKLLDLGYIKSQGGNRNRTYMLCCEK